MNFFCKKPKLNKLENKMEDKSNTSSPPLKYNIETFTKNVNISDIGHCFTNLL